MISYRNFAKAIVVLVLLGTLVNEGVNAQQISRRQRWEYCAIMNSGFTKFVTPAETKATGTATICYFQNTSCKTEENRIRPRCDRIQEKSSS